MSTTWISGGHGIAAVKADSLPEMRKESKREDKYRLALMVFKVPAAENLMGKGRGLLRSVWLSVVRARNCEPKEKHWMKIVGKPEIARIESSSRVSLAGAKKAETFNERSRAPQ